MYPWYKEMKDGFDYELPEDDQQAIQQLYGAPDYRSKWANIPQYRPAAPTTTTTTTTTTTPRPRWPPRRRIQPNGPYDDNPDRRRPMHPNEKYPFTYPPRTYTPRTHPPRTHPPRTNPPRTNPPRTNPPRTNPPRTNPPRSHHPRHHPNHLPTTVSTDPTTKPPPDTCDTSYDAVSVIRREVFIFKDAYFWRIGNSGVLRGYPALIRRLWHGLPADLTHVDAVYERSDGKIVFFVGDRYYVFSDNHVENGYPKPLTHLGLPREITKIDGAMIWGYNGKTYFYSGDLYWKFDEDTQKVELDYPRNMQMWRGVGRNIDAVFQWKDGKTYFFKGKGFWKFNDYLMHVEHEEQKLSAPFWMGCSKNYEHHDRHIHRVGDKLPYRAESSASTINFNTFMFIVVLCVAYLGTNQ